MLQNYDDTVRLSLREAVMADSYVEFEWPTVGTGREGL